MVQNYNYFWNKWDFKKRILLLLFSSITFPFHNPAVYGSKLPYLGVKTMGVLGRKYGTFGSKLLRMW